MRANALQRPVKVVPNITNRLPLLLCNLAQAVAFEEVKLERLLLIRSKLFSHTIKNLSPSNRVFEGLRFRVGEPLLVKLFCAVVLPGD